MYAILACWLPHGQRVCLSKRALWVCIGWNQCSANRRALFGAWSLISHKHTVAAKRASPTLGTQQQVNYWAATIKSDHLPGRGRAAATHMRPNQLSAAHAACTLWIIRPARACIIKASEREREREKALDIYSRARSAVGAATWIN